jgi:hypothetical protein
MRDDIYNEPEIITGEKFIAKVYSPVLTDSERNRRMDAIKQASISLILSKNLTTDRK